MNPLASESGVIDLTKETVSIWSTQAESDGTTSVGIGPFDRVIGNETEVRNATRYLIDFGPNFLDLVWTSDPNYNIFEGVIDDGSSERYTFNFRRPVFVDIEVEFSPRTVIRPDVQIESPTRLTVLIGDGIDRGDGRDLRLNFRVVPGSNPAPTTTSTAAAPTPTTTVP